MVFEAIPRSREVRQSWFTTVFTSVYSLLVSFWIVLKHRPDVVLCNGPGTCVPICYSAFLLHVLGVKKCKIIFVESFCRVDTLSLTGKLLYPVASRFILQWPQLLDKYQYAEYIGQLC